MKCLTGCMAIGLAAVLGTSPAQAQGTPAGTGMTARPINIPAREMKWNRMFPELGAKSSEIVILHVDSVTGTTQLMIRVPANFHVPKHWHTANETHTVVSGTFVIECEGERTTLEAGGFNYMPRKMAHEAWTPVDQGAVLFITVDAAWDVNFVNGPPKPKDLIGGVRRAKASPQP